MGHPPLSRRALRAVACLVLLGAVAGCASLRWSVQRAWREPGERLESFPEEVAEQYDCASQQRPFFRIERNELVPPRVHPGGRFNHRLVYVLCPARPTQTVAGQLVTRIRFRGDPIVREETSAYEIKPGRWIVDSEVVLPGAAEPGVYAYELAFRSGPVRFDESLTFAVEPR